MERKAPDENRTPKKLLMRQAGMGVRILRSAAVLVEEEGDRPGAVYEPLRLVLTEPSQERRTKLLTSTLTATLLVVVAGAVIWGWGYTTQRGNPGFWHITLVSLLFWLSIAQGMTALSAILRLTHASWRYELNRLLDTASLYGFWAPALLPLLVVARRQIYALGAAEYANNLWRVAGPAVWDALAVGTAFAAGWMLFWLTSIPDFALLRARAPADSAAARRYAALAGGWVGAQRQWSVLRAAEGILVVGVLVSFVASQTVLGWDFQLASAHGWDSSVFAPLYTVSSLLGGTAMAVLVALVGGRLLGRGYFTVRHYESLGRLLIGLGLLWFYMRWCDYLTAWYERIPTEWAIQSQRISTFPVWAALMTFGCFVLPVFGCALGWVRRSPAAVGAISVFVLAGVAVQRYLDTVPTFAPLYPASALNPTLPTALAFLGMASMFVLTYLAAARFVPMISVWGLIKSRTRKDDRSYGSARVTVMVEDPPVWET